MLTGIEVQNYRGIRQGRIDNFGEVNLFVGPNGSGKSTLLEAIFLGAFEINKDFDFQGVYQDQAVPLLALRHNERSFASDDLWYRKKPVEEIRIDYYFRNGETGSFRIVRPGTNPQVFRNGLAPFFSEMKLLDIRVLLDPSHEQRAWDRLIDVRGDRELRSLLNEVYSVGIESFTYSAYTHKLKVLFESRDYALNVDDLAAGIRIALRLFAAMLLSSGSAVLAEEFDGYQHIESFPRLVHALCTLAKRTNTQLFLATHSRETVRQFVTEAVSTGSVQDLRVFQTELGGDGTFEAAGFSAEEAETLLTGGFDLRKTS